MTQPKFLFKGRVAHPPGSYYVSSPIDIATDDLVRAIGLWLKQSCHNPCAVVEDLFEQPHALDHMFRYPVDYEAREWDHTARAEAFEAWATFRKTLHSAFLEEVKRRSPLERYILDSGKVDGLEEADFVRMLAKHLRLNLNTRGEVMLMIGDHTLSRVKVVDTVLGPC